MNKTLNNLYNLWTNGGKGSGNHNPGQGRGVGKPESGGSSKSSSYSKKPDAKYSAKKTGKANAKDVARGIASNEISDKEFLDYVDSLKEGQTVEASYTDKDGVVTEVSVGLDYAEYAKIEKGKISKDVTGLIEKSFGKFELKDGDITTKTLYSRAKGHKIDADSKRTSVMDGLEIITKDNFAIEGFIKRDSHNARLYVSYEGKTSDHAVIQAEINNAYFSTTVTAKKRSKNVNSKDSKAIEASMMEKSKKLARALNTKLNSPYSDWYN